MTRCRQSGNVLSKVNRRFKSMAETAMPLFSRYMDQGSSMVHINGFGGFKTTTF